MRIGIDYRLASSSYRGMARYCREITASLAKLDRENQYVLYSNTVIDMNTSNFSFRYIKKFNYIINEQILLPWFAWRDKLDVLWCPYNTFPLFLNRKCRLFVTIHDLIFLSLPNGKETLKQKIGRIYRKVCVLLGKKMIEVCFTVSEYSARQIRNTLGIDKLYLTYNCISTFYNLVNTAKSSISIPTRKNFYFAVSGDAPSKNLIFLLNVFINLDCCLIVAGVKKESNLRKQYIYDNIIFLDDGISDNTLIHYYLTCKAFIFPSLQEGFGIPLLEAMVCDTPIIASDSTSIPEVVGEYGILFDPTSEESLKNAMGKTNTLNLSSDIEKKKHLEKYLDWDKTAMLVKETFLKC